MGDYKLYSDISSKETFLEIWGGSTKHPDLKFNFSDYEGKASGAFAGLLNTEDELFGWLLECSSKLLLPTHAFFLAEWVLMVWGQTRGLYPGE